MVIIDGYNIVYKSHYAFSSLVTSQGLLSGAIYGFLTNIRALRKKFPDSQFVIAWDTNATRKKEAFPEYKANRNSFDISQHVKDLKIIFSSTNVWQADKKGEEADDVMSSLAKKYSDLGKKVFVYSGDKDMLQIVRDGKIIVIKPKVGNSPETYYDEEAVKAKWGVTPKEIPCFLSLRGDTSDNIPGVPRLPSKLIIDLTNKYKEPRKIYASLDKETLTDFQKNGFQKSEQQVHLNYDLIKLRYDLDVNVVKGTKNAEVLQDVLDKYEITAIKADSYVDIFEEGPYIFRKDGPSVESFSLF